MRLYDNVSGSTRFPKISSLAAPSADSRNTRHRTPFFLPMPAHAPRMRWVSLILQQLLCCSWIEQRKSSGAYSTLTAVVAAHMKKKLIRAAARSTAAVKKILDYSTRNGNLRRLEPHFQLSATRSASREGTEGAVTLPHSRECTKEPISALPNYGSKGKSGARPDRINYEAS